MKRIIIMAVVVLLIPIASYGSKREITNYVVTTQVGSTELIDSINIVNTKPLNEEQETMIKELVTRHALENKDLAYTSQMVSAIATTDDSGSTTTIKRSFIANGAIIASKLETTQKVNKASIAGFLFGCLVMFAIIIFYLMKENMRLTSKCRSLECDNDRLENQICHLKDKLESK